MERQQILWKQSSNIITPFVIALAIAAFVELLLAVYLICVTGRKPGDRELHTGRLDRVFTDILAAAFILIVLLWFTFARVAFYNELFDLPALSTGQVARLGFLVIFTAACASACGLIILSAVRKLKAGKFLRHSLIYIILYGIYDLLKSLYDGRVFARYPLTKSLFYRQLVFISSSFLLVLLTFLFLAMSSYLILLPPAAEIVMIYWYIRGNNKTFDDINKGFNESLDEQMKSERMKVALVTNVSHDLKTPLTSIISYVDLLAKEEGLSASARDYVRIVADKSNRLKHIVSDLFDLAKSTSGSMPLDIESLDLKKLLEQTLADMEDETGKSGLIFRVRLPEKPLTIHADGKKLYRVFQNIIGNAIKYSMKNTRVYIELEEKGGTAVATVKNTAGYEMDFTADEILQRFSRGDKSRSTEGSGLGLSIAESFTNICGGDFKVDVDGDLFKVTIRFKLAS